MGRPPKQDRGNLPDWDKGNNKKEYFKVMEQTRRDKKSPRPPDSHLGTCDICGKIPSKLKADHDHSCHSAKQFPCEVCLRGFLCHKCNLGLGMFDDNEENLVSALNYLIDYRRRRYGLDS